MKASAESIQKELPEFSVSADDEWISVLVDEEKAVVAEVFFPRGWWVPRDQQAGICKGNLTDTGDPVGLWSVNKDTKDWVRTATYKAFCDALAGK